MRLNLIKPLLLIITAATLAGCATHKDELLPHGGRTMQDIWYHEGGEGGSGQVARRQLLDVRQSLRRPLTEADVHAAPMEQASTTRPPPTHLTRQFSRLYPTSVQSPKRVSV